MNQQATQLIQEVINQWKQKKIYTYQQKEVSFSKSPIDTGEYILRFHIQLKGFYCQGQEIPISLSSQVFHTTTLSDHPLSDNVKADQWRLEKLLKDIDEEFDALVSDKFTACPEVIFTNDPLFF